MTKRPRPTLQEGRTGAGSVRHMMLLRRLLGLPVGDWRPCVMCGRVVHVEDAYPCRVELACSAECQERWRELEAW